MPMSSRLLRPKARAPSGFDLRTIANLAFWLDAADTSSVTLDSGRVAEIRDKSGAGLHAANSTSGSTQPSYTANAKNGLHGIVFDNASSQFLACASAADWHFLSDGTQYTAYVVAAMLSTGNNRDMATTYSGTATGVLWRTVVGAQMDITFTIRNATPANAMTLQPSSGTFNSGDFLLMRFVGDPANGTASARGSITLNEATTFQNNTQTAAPSANSAQSPLHLFCRGASPRAQHMGGTLCEMAIFKRLLSASEVGTVSTYLKNKWALY